MASLPYLRQTIRPFTTSLPTTLSASSRVAPSAAFSTSSIQQALKESDRSIPSLFTSVSSVHVGFHANNVTDRDNLSNEYDSHKEENLKDVKSGKASWKEQLASESEAGVKADRGESSTAGVDDIVRSAKEAALKKQKK